MFKEGNNKKDKKPAKSAKPAQGDVKNAKNGHSKKAIRADNVVCDAPNVSGSDETLVTRKARNRRVCEVNGTDENSEVKKVKLNNQGWNVTCFGSIEVGRKDLNLLITLNSGQSYRWNRLDEDVWRGIFGHKLWTLHQNDAKIDFKAVWYSKDPPQRQNDNITACQNELREYFRLDFPLQSYYNKWSAADDHFAKIAKDFYGLRMIKQDPVENTFAFICSSNNTIARMRSMVEFLCTEYGEEICYEGTTKFYDFPKFDALNSDEDLLNKLVTANFGFRAKYVAGSIAHIAKQGGMTWFNRLTRCNYVEATSMLMELPGIGRKIADCIRLTALDHLDTIPVDTHVYQVACRYYLPHVREKKNVTAKSYDEIVEKFTTLFGAYCGWAHTVLFCSDLQQHSALHSDGNAKGTAFQKSKYFSK